MSFGEIISDEEILYTHTHTNTYCMRSLNPSPIFLAGVTDRTSMLHIFTGSSERENTCCIT